MLHLRRAQESDWFGVGERHEVLRIALGFANKDKTSMDNLKNPMTFVSGKPINLQLRVDAQVSDAQVRTIEDLQAEVAGLRQALLLAGEIISLYRSLVDKP